MTHDVHDIERELEDAFAARAANARVSGDASTRIDARVTQLRHRSYIRMTTSLVAIVVIIGASAVVVTSGRGKKEHVNVAGDTLPSFAAPALVVPGTAAPVNDPRAFCTRVETVGGKPKCAQPYSLVNMSFGGVSVTTELGTPPFFIDRGLVSIRDFYPPKGRATKVRGHDGILYDGTTTPPQVPAQHAVAPQHMTTLTWSERPGLLVRVVGSSETEVRATATKLIERSRRVPVTYITNTFVSGTSRLSVVSNGKPVVVAKAMVGLRSENGQTCFGVLDAAYDVCRSFDRTSTFRVVAATKSAEPVPVVMGTVRPDAATVKVTFASGTTLTSNVGGAALGMGVGFWAVDWPNNAEPRDAVALDAGGRTLAHLDVQAAFPASPPNFTVVQTGSVGGHEWRVAEGTVNGVPCAEIAYLQEHRYFCNVNLTPLAVGAVENFTFARLAPNATHARIDRNGNAPVDMTVVHAAGMNVGIAPHVDGAVVATDDSGKEVGRLPTVLANNGAITSAAPLGSGTTANGAWQSVVTPPPLLMDTAANAAAGKRDDGTLCTGASYGEAQGLTCVSHWIYDGFIGGNAAAAATLRVPPVMVGIVHANVPNVEVRFVDGSVQRVATIAAPGVPAVRVWSIGMPAPIKELVSLDASGREIATSTNFIDAARWPGA